MNCTESEVEPVLVTEADLVQATEATATGEPSGSPDPDAGTAISAPGPTIGPEDEQSSSLHALEEELLESTAEDDSPPPACGSAPSADFCLPEPLTELINQRLRIWSEILAIEERRSAMGGSSAREIRDELARQERELQRAATMESLGRALEELKKKLASPALPSLAGKEPEPLKPGEPKPLEVFRSVLEGGLKQAKLLLLLTHLEAKVPEVAVPAAEDEPLLVLCRRLGIEIDPLMGWTYYALGLFQRLAQCRKLEDEYAARVAAVRAREEAAGLMSRLKNACLGEESEEIPPPEPAIARVRAAAERELRIIDPVLSERFWKLYGDLAWVLASGQATGEEQPAVRAFLRYGMIAVHPGLISPETREFILEECRGDIAEWVNAPEATHVVYADEYITAIHDRRLTVSPDEDLELNARGSEEWKADRVWRQAAAYSATTQLYTERLEQLRVRVEELAATCEKQKAEFQAFKTRSDPRASALGDALASNRADLARLKQAVERFETKLLPESKDRVQEAGQRFDKAAELLTPEKVVRREAVFIRRLARLSARLKEPYLPFVLRDTFVPKRSDHFSRTSVLESVAKLEKADGRVFHQVLINNKRPDRRVTLRISPTFLILPGRGQMGFSLCPRKWDDFGRLVLPVTFLKQNGLEDLLTDIVSDFRWDCSKEEAGAEWITADALCAAYAAVRWNYRRFGEKTQKAMGINRKQKDRENWRIHYRLFIASAHDRGRYLFNKCFEVYKDVVLRHIGLPPGVEPLRRD